ncbi:hypothetical protein FSARC_9634 [Fusarium sarcochroum]|uniref:Uncharacterized protein n=1 Tax=Fusarium sarcochroum TaxID=1208366 RepID=A0A8H4X624_9HYPO|nr:hypothetical protein FSARC_9634 [Fusarium sarcochroum]
MGLGTCSSDVAVTTITATGKPTTQPTTTLTATTTQVDSVTATDTTTSNDFDTITTTEIDTNTVTVTSTSTTTSTSTIPYKVQSICTVFKQAVSFGRSGKKPLPASCSCFLTSTKAAPVKTATVTSKKPTITRTVYKIGGPRKTVTRTVVITRYAACPTLSAPETMTTSTTTITQTDRTLTTEINTETSTTTETEAEIDTVTATLTTTTTAIATAGPCDDLNRLRVSGECSLTSPNVVVSAVSSGANIAQA